MTEIIKKDNCYDNQEDNGYDSDYQEDNSYDRHSQEENGYDSDRAKGHFLYPIWSFILSYSTYTLHYIHSTHTYVSVLY